MPHVTPAEHRANTLCFVGVEALWGLGMALVSVNHILPSLVNALGGSAFLVGLVPAIWAAGASLAQFFAASIAGHRPRRKGVVFWLHMAVPVPNLVFAALLAFPIAAAHRGLTLGTFFLLFTLGSIGLGLLIPVWTNFMAWTTDPARRGAAFGAIFFAQTLSGIAGSALASRILGGPLPFPAGYALCFALQWLTASLGNLFFLPIHEHPGETSPPRAFREHARRFASILRDDPPFRAYLWARSLIVVFPLVVGFYTVEAQRALGIGGREAALFGAVFLAAQAPGNLLFGWIGDRYGHRTTQWIGNALLLAGIGLVLLPPSLPLAYAASALFGAFFSTEFNAHLNLVMNFCPNPDKTDYITVAGLFLAPARILIPLAGGAIIGALGARPVWTVVLLSVACGMWLLARVQEPGRGGPPPPATPTAV